MYLSLAQSLFPLGQGISQPVASILVKKLRQIKVVLMASIIIAICGNVTYMAAQKADSVVLIILGRALAGFGAGEKAIIYLLFWGGGVAGIPSREKRNSNCYM